MLKRLQILINKILLLITLHYIIKVDIKVDFLSFKINLQIYFSSEKYLDITLPGFSMPDSSG